MLSSLRSRLRSTTRDSMGLMRALPFPAFALGGGMATPPVRLPAQVTPLTVHSASGGSRASGASPGFVPQESSEAGCLAAARPQPCRRADWGLGAVVRVADITFDTDNDTVAGLVPMMFFEGDHVLRREFEADVQWDLF
jgi:hypothetical protein